MPNTTAFSIAFKENIRIISELDTDDDNTLGIITEEEFDKFKKKDNAYEDLNFIINRNLDKFLLKSTIQFANKIKDNELLEKISASSSFEEKINFINKYEALNNSVVDFKRLNWLSWDLFKKKFIDIQQDKGFRWTYSDKKGLELLGVIVDVENNEVKDFLNKIRYDMSNKIGFDEFLNEYFHLENNNKNHNKIKDILKEEAKNAIINACLYDSDHKKIKFDKDSFCIEKNYKYEVKIEENLDKKSIKKQSERYLGVKVLKKIKQLFGLSIIKDTQGKLANGKYENKDFFGVSIDKKLNGDEFLLYSFELKTSSQIYDVYTAFSQALNYRSRSNYVYIIIPNFLSSFFEPVERYNEIIDILNKNGIGAVSIDITAEHEIKDVNIVVPAKKMVLDNDEWLKSLQPDLDAKGYQKCLLCNRITTEKERQQDAPDECGWKVEGKHCMRKRQEDYYSNKRLTRGRTTQMWLENRR